jgi:superfamily II DNA/RNA helicase
MSLVSPPAPADAQGFDSLGVDRRLVTSLANSGIVSAFPIQAATLPDSLAGRDVLGRGRTGSGKTVAFSVPLVSRLADSGDRSRARYPRGMVLVPTRELATQVAATLKPLAHAVGLRVVTIVGGVSQVPQVKELRRGVDVVVATPGRLEDLIGQGHCRLDDVEVSVLDEADHMADLGFLPAVKRLLDATPAGGQRLLFSATLDKGVDVLVRRYLSDPKVHEVDSADSPVPAMTHHVLKVASGDKAAVVRQLASGSGRSLLFTRTKYGAKKLAAQLDRQGIAAVELHGNLSQAARARNLDAFSSGEAVVLVATDIAARGIHVDDVGLVVHVDPPAEHKAYLHRSGRTARAGAEGVVVTIMIPNQQRDVRSLAKAAGISPITTDVEPGHPLLAELAGPTADPVRRPARTARTAPEGRERQRSGGPSRSSRDGRRPGYKGKTSGGNHSGGQRSGGQRSGGQHAGGHDTRSQETSGQDGRQDGRQDNRGPGPRGRSGKPQGQRGPGGTKGSAGRGGAKASGGPRHKSGGSVKAGGSTRSSDSGKPGGSHKPGSRPSGGPRRGGNGGQSAGGGKGHRSAAGRSGSRGRPA